MPLKFNSPQSYWDAEAGVQLLQDVQSSPPQDGGAVEQKLRRKRLSWLLLLPVDLAPKWTVRPFIMNGYRPQSSVKACFQSALQAHNETANVWSHFLGAILMVALAVHLVISMRNMSTRDLGFGLFLLLSTAVCMSTSAVYHLFCVHSEGAYHRLLRCDMSGISLMATAGWFTGIEYGFYCFDTLRWRYFYLSSFICAAALLWPFFSCTSRRFWFTITFYTTMAVLGLVPLFHWWNIAGRTEVAAFGTRMLGVFGWYAVGLFFYVTKIPERWAPGRFDNLGNSHLLWHICVIGAGLQLYGSMAANQQWRMMHPCTPATES